MPPKKVLNHKSFNTLNTPYLVIVESPSKCGKIEKYLGFQYKCIASKGHIREIKKVHSRKYNYKPEYEIIKEKYGVVREMQSIVSQFDPKNVFLGTDDDREGESIAWHICKVCELDIATTPRILFREITQKALQDAVKNPTKIRMNIVHAQQARQVVDRMIGFKISPLLSKLIVHDSKSFLSAGRCQTPTLRLVYDRHQESKRLKESGIFYKVEGDFVDNPTISVKLNVKFDHVEKVHLFFEKSKTFSHILSIFPKVNRSSSPPQPFSTSKLLQHASTVLHLSPKVTMDMCQKLYQGGYITYMRTESVRYSTTYLRQAKEYITDHYGESYVGGTERIQNNDSNNPHEAIRVTQLFVREVEDVKLQSLYNVIWRRSVESCMSVYEYEEHTVNISAPDTCKYETSIEVPIFLGWKGSMIPKGDFHQMQEKASNIVFSLKHFDNKKVSFVEIRSIMSIGEQEKHYQEASLIQKLESLGIGRPSTFSMLVETVQERKYVLKENLDGVEKNGTEYIMNKSREIVDKSVKKIFGSKKNQLCVQDLGIKAIDVLYEHFAPLFDYEYTSKMESALDALVQDNDIPWYSVCEVCEDTINRCSEQLKPVLKKKYRIDDMHNVVFGKSGAMIECLDGDTKTIKSIKSNFTLDFEKLENEEYSLEELLEIPKDYLGDFEGIPVNVKTGPYGPYVVWGERKESLKGVLKDGGKPECITLDQVKELFNTKKPKDPNFLRQLNEDFSVRKGKFGMYLFYKTSNMKKPEFINIKKCPYDVLTEDSATVIEWASKK